MKQTVTITLTNKGKSGVDVAMVFEPALDKDDKRPNAALYAALKIQEALSSLAEK
jgi:hypothetical protein